MSLTQEQLKELEVLAGLFFSIPEILTALEIPIHQEGEFSEVIKYNHGHPVFIAYHKGRLTAETQLRQAIWQAALNGSNPAQSTMLEFLKTSKP